MTGSLQFTLIFAFLFLLIGLFILNQSDQEFLNRVEGHFLDHKLHLFDKTPHFFCFQLILNIIVKTERPVHHRRGEEIFGQGKFGLERQSVRI